MTHIPILRGGEPYYSLSVNTLEHVATGEPVAEISQANSGLIERDIEATHRRQRWLGHGRGRWCAGKLQLRKQSCGG